MLKSFISKFISGHKKGKKSLVPIVLTEFLFGPRVLNWNTWWVCSSYFRKWHISPFYIKDLNILKNRDDWKVDSRKKNILPLNELIQLTWYFFHRVSKDWRRKGLCEHEPKDGNFVILGQLELMPLFIGSSIQSN